MAAKTAPPGAVATVPDDQETAQPTTEPAHAAVEGSITPPQFDAGYLDNPHPVYPALSRRMGEEGKVLLRVFVEFNGQPGQIQVSASSGSARLDRAAQETVGRWKFIPARRGSETVSTWVLVPIVFSLRS